MENTKQASKSFSADTVSETEKHRRPIRSFVLRQGRLSPGQARAVDMLGPQYVLPYKADAVLNMAKIFERDAPTIVEIGFGMGNTTADIAQQLSDKNFIGIEVHTPGVGSLLKMIAERNLTNLRLIQHDAVEVLRDNVTDASLAGLHIFFPDPWPKKRHHKRRLIQPAFVTLLVQKLQTQGYIHLATDWQPYAEHMLEVLQAEPQLVSTKSTASTASDYAARPLYRTESNFERKGLAKGHGVWDLVFIKR